MLAKAAALGLPRGPLFAALKRGETVTLEDGRRIMPEQVVDPAEPGAHLLIVGEVDPLSTLFGQLVADATLSAYAEGGSMFGRLALVVHLSKQGYLEHEAYRGWARSLGPQVQHVYLDHGTTGPASSAFLAAKLLRAKLAAVCPEICAAAEDHCPGIESSDSDSPGGWVRGRSLLGFVLAPRRKQGLISPDPPPIDDEEARFREELRDNQELHALLAQAHRQRDCALSAEEGSLGEGDRLLRSEEGAICFLGELTNFSPPFMTGMVFVGTGSAIPCKYRNVSGAVLLLSGGGVLLDAGEGSWSQMQATGLDVKALRLAWVSHPHADHHLGLMRVIVERYRRLPPESRSPLVVVAPPSVVALLEDLVSFDTTLRGTFLALSCSLFDVDHPSADEMSTSLSAAMTTLQALGVSSLRCCKVDHCAEAYAVRLDMSSGLSVVYSGDTRPCERLVRLASAATVLIHEATFGDDHAAEAVEKRHSTVSEAVEVSRRSGAHRTVLTHYSQRYPSFPPIAEHQRRQVTLAFDFMRISFKDLLWSQHLTPALLTAFPPEEEADEVSEALEEVAESARRTVGAFAASRRCDGGGGVTRPKRKIADAMT